MKRMLAALAALLIPCSAMATATGKVLVVDIHQNIAFSDLGGAGEQAEFDVMSQRVYREMGEAFRMLGVNYRVIDQSLAKTTFLRTGDVVWNYGTSAAYVEHFDAVIYPRWYGTTAIASCHPESLTKSCAACYPTVPQLAFRASDAGFQNGEAFNTNSSDSTGGDGTGPLVAGGGGASPSLETSKDGSRRWWTSANASTFGLLPVNGGLRIISRANVAHGIEGGSDLKTVVGTGIACSWCDTLQFQQAQVDSATTWLRLNSHITGAQPFIFSTYFGASPCTDSSGTTIQACEGDIIRFLEAFSLLDSLTGHKLIDPAKLPIRVGAVIVGAFNRSGRGNPGGVADADSAALKASLDSLAALPGAGYMRLNVVADVDSAPSHPNELAWWNKLPAAKFIPYTRLGMDTTVAQNWTFSGPVDVFGRYRKRAFAGNSVPGAGDSSIATGLHSLFFKADSIFRPERVTRFVVAPLDDWTPKNMFWTANAIDSLAYAIRSAGGVGVLQDMQRPEASPSAIVGNRDLVRGWTQVQRSYVSPYGGGPLRILGHSGYMIGGANRLWLWRTWYNGPVGVDSVPPYTGTTGSGAGTVFSILNYESGRFWHQIFSNSWRDVDWMPQDIQHDAYDDVITPKVDRFYPFRKAYVYKLHVQDLAGGQTPANRPGYWILKSAWMAMQQINALNGRTVITFDYLNNINPEQ